MRMKLQYTQSSESVEVNNSWDWTSIPDWYYRKCGHDFSYLNLNALPEEFIGEFIKKYEFVQIDEILWTDGQTNRSFWNDNYKCGFVIRVRKNKETGKNSCSEAKLFYTFGKKPEILICDLIKNEIPVTPKKNHINLITMKGNSFELKELPIKEKQNIDLKLNYGKNFLSINEKIHQILNNDENGLIILNGCPGSGKTTFIRYLLSDIKKKVIFIPPNMVGSISDPGFITFLLDHPDSILLIEDAEEAVISREENVRTQSVSNLLNISDGILGDCLKMKILCTFNTDIGNIDNALLRKGRLSLKYEFDRLSIDDSNNLLENLGRGRIAKVSMTLAEIYNSESQPNLTPEKDIKKVGFI